MNLTLGMGAEDITLEDMHRFLRAAEVMGMPKTSHLALQADTRTGSLRSITAGLVVEAAERPGGWETK